MERKMPKTLRDKIFEKCTYSYLLSYAWTVLLISGTHGFLKRVNYEIPGVSPLKH